MSSLSVKSTKNWSMWSDVYIKTTACVEVISPWVRVESIPTASSASGRRCCPLIRQTIYFQTARLSLAGSAFWMKTVGPVRFVPFLHWFHERYYPEKVWRELSRCSCRSEKCIWYSSSSSSSSQTNRKNPVKLLKNDVKFSMHLNRNHLKPKVKTT